MLYQIKMGGITLFHGGDSGYVTLKDYPSDIAFVPIGRMSPTASPENAYKMVVDVKPEVAVAMHGSDKQKQQFSRKSKNRCRRHNGFDNGALYRAKPLRLMK